MRSIEEEQNPKASNDFKTVAQATDRLWPPWNRTKLSNNNDNNEDSHHNNMIGVLLPHFQKVFVIDMVIDDLIVVGFGCHDIFYFFFSSLRQFLFFYFLTLVILVVIIFLGINQSHVIKSGNLVVCVGCHVLVDVVVVVIFVDVVVLVVVIADVVMMG